MKARNFIRWLITLIIVAVVIFLIKVLIIDNPEDVYENPLTPVKIAKPYRADICQTLELNGYIEAQSMIPVVPFVSGTVTQYLAKEGEYVQKDQILACIDSKSYELQKQQAEAVYLAAKATFERVSNLYDSGAATKQNYDEAKAQVDAYKAQLDLADVQLSYCKVTAPVSGTILQANSAEGSVGVSSSPLFIIANLDNLQINLNVSEKYFNLINENKNTLMAQVSGNGVCVKAHIETVSQYVSPDTKTFKVTLVLDEGTASFRPGMYVSVSLEYEKRTNALVVDQKTVNTNGSVYIYDEETQTAKLADVKVLTKDNNHVSIEEKWKNTWFIVEGQSKVLDGQKVSVL